MYNVEFAALIIAPLFSYVTWITTDVRMRYNTLYPCIERLPGSAPKLLAYCPSSHALCSMCTKPFTIPYIQSKYFYLSCHISIC